MFLNNKLYKRFGLELDIKKVQIGFGNFVKFTILQKLNNIIDYTKTLEVHREDYRNVNLLLLKDLCEQLFCDNSLYDFPLGLEYFIKEEYGKLDDFSEYLVKIQILINILFTCRYAKIEYNNLINEIDKYLKNYPLLGVQLKIYKSKPAQILPSISKYFDELIDNTLGILEENRFDTILKEFEDGLKEFLSAKTTSKLKNVVEDMYTAVDHLVKIILSDKNKGFRHIFNDNNYKYFGFTNKNPKELYKNLRNWMDGIKHGAIKQYDRLDVELIIVQVSALIRYSILKSNTKS